MKRSWIIICLFIIGLQAGCTVNCSHEHPPKTKAETVYRDNRPVTHRGLQHLELRITQSMTQLQSQHLQQQQQLAVIYDLVKWLRTVLITLLITAGAFAFLQSSSKKPESSN